MTRISLNADAATEQARTGDRLTKEDYLLAARRLRAEAAAELWQSLWTALRLRRRRVRAAGRIRPARQLA
ncbi:hypothetical protein ACFOGJ_03315 [Marinibaculum pumilum]|uniref:Uncharacterized protein n=1 Tax=Marinibaculum pumilum TaxID=1766165 RepID=A0ABV7KVB0_9PROT